MDTRVSGEAARRAKRGRQSEKKRLSRAISHARGHLRVSRFTRRTTEKRGTAHIKIVHLKTVSYSLEIIYLKRAFFLSLAFNALFCRLLKGTHPTVN